VREQLGGVEVAHPVVGVRAVDAVLRVLERLLRPRGGVVTAGTVLAPGSSRPSSARRLPARPSPCQPGIRRGRKTTFTVALTSDVDSLNPFLGVEANSYEMWALTYDYLVGYSMKDMSPEPGLATSWDTSVRRQDLDLPPPRRREVVRRPALTAADVAYTYNRVLHGEIEATNWSSYLNNVTKVTAPDPTPRWC
jgi:ABC-type transport system substrate-binding protein